VLEHAKLSPNRCCCTGSLWQSAEVAQLASSNDLK
jgi:hypothetical protein